MLGKILLGGLVGYAIGKHSQRTPIDADSDGHYSIETGGDDCNDHSSLINPNRREDCNTPVDDNCDGSLNDLNALNCDNYYRDSDGDGFGNASDVGCYCNPTSEYTSTDPSDCYDENVDVGPGQTQYFSRDRGDGQYDYDCDNMEAKYEESIGACETSMLELGCVASMEGWLDSVPECGESNYTIRDHTDCTFKTDGWVWEWGCYPTPQTETVQLCK